MDGPGALAHFTARRNGETMILLTRLNGPQIAVNADLIERAEATPDTVLTLVDGTKYLVAESVQEVIDKVRLFRASVLVAAKELEENANQPRATLRALPQPEES
jgi:flagellar protein FlbD